MLHDQISASGVSSHDFLLLNYKISVTCATDKYFTYRDFKNRDYVTLNIELDNIWWDQVYTLGNANDQLSFVQENERQLYYRFVTVKTNLIRQPWFNTEMKTLIEKRDSGSKRWKVLKIAKRLHHERKFSNAINLNGM